MGKRGCNMPAFPDLSEKKSSNNFSPPLDIKPGTILTDVLGKQWKLGKTVGTGGFGEIYLASDSILEAVDYNSQYVAKVERHTSGPLFVEIHCYLNIAKPDSVNKWTESKKLLHLGVPHYISSGSHTINDVKYRFLIMPRFNKDLQHMLEAKNYKFNLKTVLAIARQVIDVLEYIHSKGYVHSDIKASNILLASSKEVDAVYLKYRGATPMRTCKLKKVVRPNMRTRAAVVNGSRRLNKQVGIDKLYLVDYGLAAKYVTSDGSHKEFCSDNRKAHAGTVLFCSRDAHEGAQSRRSDLECLGYNIIYWLTSNLPWSHDLDDHDLVYKKKQRCIENLKHFLEFCFDYECPRFLYTYFSYLQKLNFDDEPDYHYCKCLFKNALLEHGYKDNLQLDFDGIESQISLKKMKYNLENLKVKRELALQKLKRSPLKSNLPVRPRLRKQLKTEFKANMNWSKILMDPEILIKNAIKAKKPTEIHETCGLGLLNLDVHELNPTEAMIDVYNKFMDRQNNYGISIKERDDITGSCVDGYTPAMMKVYKCIKRQKLLLVSKNRKKSFTLKAGFGKKASTANSPVQKKSLRKAKSNPLKAKQLNKRIYSLRG